MLSDQNAINQPTGGQNTGQVYGSMDQQYSVPSMNQQYLVPSMNQQYSVPMTNNYAAATTNLSTSSNVQHDPHIWFCDDCNTNDICDHLEALGQEQNDRYTALEEERAQQLRDEEATDIGWECYDE